MTTTPQELKPCPFCGEKPKEGEVINSHGKFYTIWCCFTRMEFHSYQAEEYVTRWNTRCAAEPVDAGELDAAIERHEQRMKFIAVKHTQQTKDYEAVIQAARSWLSNVTSDEWMPIDAAKFMLKNCVSWLSTNGYRDAALQIIDLPLPNFDKIPTKAKGGV